MPRPRTPFRVVWLLRATALAGAVAAVLVQASNPDRASTAAERSAFDLPPRPVETDHARLHPGSDPQSPCTCELAKVYGGWCRRCNVGYIANHRVESAMLFEMIDPHGHDLDIEMLRSKVGPEVVPNDLWCDAAAMGFVGGKAFFTRLTWGLAKGSPAMADRLTCPFCRAHSGDDPAWCEHCRRGMVGNVAFADRALFEQTASEYRNFLAAIDREKTCNLCAYAMVAHTRCPKSKNAYRLSASDAH